MGMIWDACYLLSSVSPPRESQRCPPDKILIRLLIRLLIRAIIRAIIQVLNPPALHR